MQSWAMIIVKLNFRNALVESNAHKAFDEFIYKHDEFTSELEYNHKWSN